MNSNYERLINATPLDVFYAMVLKEEKQKQLGSEQPDTKVYPFNKGLPKGPRFKGLARVEAFHKMLDKQERELHSEDCYGWPATGLFDFQTGRNYPFIAGKCTDSAELVARKFRGRVVGLPGWDDFQGDPRATRFSLSAGIAAFGTFHPAGRQGHDFAILDNLLVDVWAVRHGYLERAIWDLREPDDLRFVNWIYGDCRQWELLMDFRELGWPKDKKGRNR